MGNSSSSPKDLPPKENYTDRELLNKSTALRYPNTPCSGFQDILQALDNPSLTQNNNETEINNVKNVAELYWVGCVSAYIDRYV
jgi:hypothetical protein